MKVVMIDNYDSFTYNLVQYLGQCGAEVVTYRNDQVSLAQIEAQAPDRLVISPGPGNPGNNPACLGVGFEIVRSLSHTIPTLGVCLGCQGIGVAYGGKVAQAQALMHGKTSTVTHNGEGLFHGLKNPLRVGRYHSLVLEPSSVPDALEVTATSDDGEVMGIRHRDYPIHGVQFHPESILTSEGFELIDNFVNLNEGAVP